MNGSEKECICIKDGVIIETIDQSKNKPDAWISPDELDKLLEDSIGESQPIPVH